MAVLTTLSSPDEAVLVGPELHERGRGRQRHYAHQRAGHPRLLPLRDSARRAYQHLQGNTHTRTHLSCVYTGTCVYTHTHTYTHTYTQQQTTPEHTSAINTVKNKFCDYLYTFAGTITFSIHTDTDRLIEWMQVRYIQ